MKPEDPPASFYTGLGDNRYYNVDLIPKFIMACGEGRRVCFAFLLFQPACAAVCRQAGEDFGVHESHPVFEFQANRRQFRVQE